MSNLTFIEKTKLEKCFNMGGGYVLDFSNRTFAEFIAEITGKDIYDPKYENASGSKANRFRAFWKQESNYVVGKLLSELLEYRQPSDSDEVRLFDECKRISARLLQSSPVEAIESITAEGTERGFEMLAKAVREAIEKNEPEIGLDRLHTYIMKLIRTFAEKRGIKYDKDKPLHGIFGEYVKALRSNGLIESEMTERILKSSIGTLEAFNAVRNDRSLAHDNPMLGYEESLFIFNHVCSAVRFIKALEEAADKAVASKSSTEINWEE